MESTQVFQGVINPLEIENPQPPAAPEISVNVKCNWKITAVLCVALLGLIGILTIKKSHSGQFPVRIENVELRDLDFNITQMTVKLQMDYTIVAKDLPPMDPLASQFINLDKLVLVRKQLLPPPALSPTGELVWIRQIEHTAQVNDAQELEGVLSVLKDGGVRLIIVTEFGVQNLKVPPNVVCPIKIIILSNEVTTKTLPCFGGSN